MIGGAVLGIAVACAAVIPGCAEMADPPPSPVCEADASGTVWAFYTDDDIGCDVVPPQVLSLTGVPGIAECDLVGGTYEPYEDIDPLDNWDDSLYGDCLGVDY